MENLIFAFPITTYVLPNYLPLFYKSLFKKQLILQH